jgi:predicted TIM-barrel fold metal-dependent hydrolase
VVRHPGVAAVFAAAAERRLLVIIHAGLGIPSLGHDARMLRERYPAAPLILAHLGVTDLVWIWRRLADHPSLFFDTAWWNPADHLALFADVPPGRILQGSDTPTAHGNHSCDRICGTLAPTRSPPAVTPALAKN